MKVYLDYFYTSCDNSACIWATTPLTDKMSWPLNPIGGGSVNRIYSYPMSENNFFFKSMLCVFRSWSVFRTEFLWNSFPDADRSVGEKCSNGTRHRLIYLTNYTLWLCGFWDCPEPPPNVRLRSTVHLGINCVHCGMLVIVRSVGSITLSYLCSLSVILGITFQPDMTAMALHVWFHPSHAYHDVWTQLYPLFYVSAIVHRLCSHSCYSQFRQKVWQPPPFAHNAFWVVPGLSCQLIVRQNLT